MGSSRRRSGYLLGHWFGNIIYGQNTVPRTRARTTWPSCWASPSASPVARGIGALTYPLAKLVGREPPPPVPETGWMRYFRYTEDHKVVGMQYLIGVLTFLFTGGLLAMAIRTQLLSPTTHVFGPDTYIAIVGEHGTIMMMMATSAVVGPSATG